MEPPRPYEIVPNEERPDRRTRRARAWTQTLEATLAAGHTVFMPGKRFTILNVGKTGWLAKQGFKVHQRAGERDGVKGVYWWAEQEAPTGNGVFNEDGSVNR